MKKISAAILVALVCLILPLGLKMQNGGGMVEASAAGDVIRIDRYDADYTVGKDRIITVFEEIDVTFLKSGLTMFYHSLPLEGDRYFDIQASCAGNADFSYYVADNPDVENFLDINCVGGTQKGKTWTYVISYKMELGVNDVENGMILDVVGFGSGVPIHNVCITMHFPDKATITAEDIYVGGYGVAAGGDIDWTLSADGKTLTLEKDVLRVVHNSEFGEDMAEGVTVRFTLPKGVLDSFLKTRIFTRHFWGILLSAIGVVVLSVLFYTFLHKKREIVTIVNLKAPDEMDPLEIGKLLDGNVDDEDITSMIYYFAHKGYLKIDLSDESDPELITTLKELPDSETTHARTLFKGLFERASEFVKEGETPFDEDVYEARMRVSSLANHFYKSVDAAKLQAPHVKMYEAKSVFVFLGGSLIGLLYAFLLPFILAVADVGGDYTYMLGVVLGVPMALICLLAFLAENYRYKWKRSTRRIVNVTQAIIALVSAVIFCVFFARHVMTEFEKALMCISSFTSCFITLGGLTRREAYCNKLGHILGFKEFIVVTEEERIRFMLEENPELYYKILPYAQVLGVTDEWEKKFENILIEPPTWYVNNDMTLFDYYILNRCLRTSMAVAMARPSSEGGSTIGRSGGGGSFGGFGGGGHGGGGFGAR
ncbi:MAG: DUF2207 domain-containing protein [Clostridia bacterium]|nr:DUF2207 domain-containing protein [Clostridia bacterium]